VWSLSLGATTTNFSFWAVNFATFSGVDVVSIADLDAPARNEITSLYADIINLPVTIGDYFTAPPSAANTSEVSRLNWVNTAVSKQLQVASTPNFSAAQTLYLANRRVIQSPNVNVPLATLYSVFQRNVDDMWKTANFLPVVQSPNPFSLSSLVDAFVVEHRDGLRSIPVVRSAVQ